jgi:PTS system nitrogen regulatory IIA component
MGGFRAPGDEWQLLPGSEERFMPYRTMTLEDFSQHVGMDVRQVQRLADRGALPGQKVGGQWRFNRARVTEWLQQEMRTFDEQRLVQLERAMGAAASEAFVTDLIGLEGIDLQLPAKTKVSVLHELVGLAERTGLLYDAEGLLDALDKREQMCSTALRYGLAIPHPRQPMPYVSAEPLVCVARLPRGVWFGSPDREMTRLFFLICCHEDRHHLRVLARLMRLLQEETVAELMEIAEPGAFLQYLMHKEREQIPEQA